MIRLSFAALFLAIPSDVSTRAAAIPEGMVDDPCVGLTVKMPPALTAFWTAAYSAKAPVPAPPFPPEYAAFRAAQAEAAKRDWANLCYYRADDARLVAGPAAARRVVFIGNSITEGWGYADPAVFTGGVINRGISGQTSPQVLLRFQSDVVALKPRVVHILVGTNDIAGNTGPTSVSDYQNTITAMVTLAKARGIRVILASIPPSQAFRWKPGIKPAQRIAELNAWLKSYASAEKLVWVDYHSALAKADGAMRPAFTRDGVHPNFAGYVAMEPLARRALAEAGAEAGAQAGPQAGPQAGAAR